MTENMKYHLKRMIKLTITSPIWIFLLMLGGISWMIGFLGVLIQGMGKSIKSGGQTLDTILVNTFTSPGSIIDKISVWVNK